MSMTLNPQNLTPWESGQSGNPTGRPKGSKNLATIVRELESDDFQWDKLPIKQKDAVMQVGSPFRAIVYKALEMAIAGDIKAMEYLRRSGYGDKLDVVSGDRETRSPLIVSTIKPREIIPATSESN